jgi:hypothetical protein
MTDTNLTPALMTDPKLILAFLFAGDATVTFKSVATGTRYTYRIQEGKAESGRIAPFFVKVLTGSDNENDYTYLGMIDGASRNFRTTKATKNPTSQPVKGFEWALNILLQGRLPVGLELWHEGRCARCSRKLTDPASIASGFGPECIKMSGGLAGLTKAGESILLDAIANTAPVTPKATPAAKVILTPAEILAAVNADPVILKLAAEVKAVPAPVAAPVPVLQPVDESSAEALARSQGWTVEEATTQLGNRKLINLTPSTEVSGAEKAVEETEQHLDDILPFAPDGYQYSHGVQYPSGHSVDGFAVIATPVVDYSSQDYGSKVAATSSLMREILEESDIKLYDFGFRSAPVLPVAEHSVLVALVEDLKKTNHGKYTLDGTLDEAEAQEFWYNHFSTVSNQPVGV